MALLVLAGSILASTALLLMGGVLAWRWTDQHLPHLGMNSAETQAVNRTELLRQIQAFQLITVEQTYSARTQQRVDQSFDLGSSHVALPDWLAGEQLTVQGQARVLAGVDLAQVRPEDIHVTGSGKHRSVQVNIPPAQVLSTELMPNTLRVSTTSGLLPLVEQAFGINDDQLRNRSADLLVQAGRQAAEQQGIDAAAGAAAQQRLAGFLQNLSADGGQVSYTVSVKPMPA
jgi:hypothetical protein